MNLSQKKNRYFYWAGYWAIFIWISATFMRPVLNLLEIAIGISGVTALVWVSFGITCGLLLTIYRSRPARLPFVEFIPITLFGVVAAAFMDVTAERVHIIKYGILGYLLASGENSSNKKRTLGSALLGALLVSSVDETFQHFIPNRVGDPRDVFFGVVGGLWGGLCALCLRQPKAPLPLKHSKNNSA